MTFLRPGAVCAGDIRLQVDIDALLLKRNEAQYFRNWINVDERLTIAFDSE